ncbi:MAG TPA: ABC transporter permease [Caldilineaceae bacterium]|nr:ABC transporter permease [Caldilineaceae bacterium]
MTKYPLRTLLRLSWRHVLRRPLQSLFFVLGVAIGVAMIVAIDLANGSASRAFTLGTETVTGRATHQIVGGPSGLDEALYTRLRRELGFRLSAPIVEDYVIALELDAQPMRLLGVDPFADAPFRSYLGAQNPGSRPTYLADLMVQPNTVLLSQSVAERYGLRPGDRITARRGSTSTQLKIVGLLAPADALSRQALEGLLVTDIATAQEVLGRVGRLDRIDLIVPAGADAESALAPIRAILPPGALLQPVAARSGTVNEMTAAFSLNLTALSLLALVVGMFLIYNTVTFSVVQRRPVLGTLRALGLTRNEVYLLILAEAGLLGLLGTVLGLALGVLLGRGMVQLVTQTINDLFFVVAVREVEIPLWTMVKGGVIGVAAALLGAAIPAYEATNAPPAGALQRSHIEERTRRALPWVSVGALCLLAVGAGLLIPEWNLMVAFGGLFAVILGGALLAPLATLALMRGAQAVTQRIGVIARMAPRTVVRSLSRTSVAVAALMVAVSVIIGVGIMVGSFRNTVAEWLGDVLQADIFISPPSLTSNQVLTTLDAGVVERMRQFPGIARVASTRGVDVTAFVPRSETTNESSTLADREEVKVRLLALSDDLAGPDRRYLESIGDWRTTWQGLVAGGVILNEPMANRLKLGVGDELTLLTDRGERSFPVVGVAVDFDVNNVVFMFDPIYRTLWDDRQISAIALFVAPGEQVEAKVAEIRAALAGQEELLVRSNRTMRANALEIFDRTFAITVALQLLATVVAFIGILSTLMSLQLERSREIGVLRSTGMTQRQLWRLSLLETGLLGSTAGLLAMPLGILLAVILIYIINLRSFGWTLAMQLQPWDFIQSFLVAVGAALLAGLYPAWRMGKMSPADAVRSE